MGEDGLATPREVGWSMAPDWAPHARCWMAWPCREAPWGGGVDEARRAYAQVAQAIAAFEPVTMIARPDLVAMASLYCGPGITILPLPHDDGWIRDVGPSFVAGPAGELAGVTWSFNGWGGAAPGLCPGCRARAPDPRAYRPAAACRCRLVLEGGRDPGRRGGDLHRRVRARCSTPSAIPA